MLIEAGHKVVCIVGGITGMVGDPRDPNLTKDAVLERTLKAKEEIDKNVQALEKQTKKIFGVEKVINNITFYSEMKV
jgi:tyrosyl-tRNA synthetase